MSRTINRLPIDAREQTPIKYLLFVVVIANKLNILHIIVTFIGKAICSLVKLGIVDD